LPWCASCRANLVQSFTCTSIIANTHRVGRLGRAGTGGRAGTNWVRPIIACMHAGVHACSHACAHAHAHAYRSVPKCHLLDIRRPDFTRSSWHAVCTSPVHIRPQPRLLQSNATCGAASMASSVVFHACTKSSVHATYANSRRTRARRVPWSARLRACVRAGRSTNHCGVGKFTPRTAPGAARTLPRALAYLEEAVEKFRVVDRRAGLG
jgi:hypothetical protein